MKERKRISALPLAKSTRVKKCRQWIPHGRARKQADVDRNSWPSNRGNSAAQAREDSLESGLEQQNDSHLSELHSKLQALRGVTTDIYRDSLSQNTLLDTTVSFSLSKFDSLNLGLRRVLNRREVRLMDSKPHWAIHRIDSSDLSRITPVKRGCNCPSSEESSPYSCCTSCSDRTGVRRSVLEGIFSRTMGSCILFVEHLYTVIHRSSCCHPPSSLRETSAKSPEK